MSRQLRLTFILGTITGLGVFIVLLWWWLSRRFDNGEVATIIVERAAPELVGGAAQEKQPEPMEEDKTPDDLRVIEGIGPKISAILLEAGIRTYTQLAATEVERLQSILEEAGIRIANPSTWPEQAKLAAAGKWEALESLQDELKGGRRAG
jgi:predicted flap endonuclease-1-like 5' DNA nuclease